MKNNAAIRTLADSGETAHSDVPARRVVEGDPVALSFSQEQLWFLQRLEPELTAYNLPRVFRLRGALDSDALERAFAAVIERHGVLRTRFFERDGVPLQQLETTAPFALETLDLSHCAADERRTRLDAAVEQVVSRVFDLGRAPALAARLIKLGDREHVLALCLHHIVSDAWSNPILARDLGQAYRRALDSSGAVHFDPLPLQYADCALWQRARAEAGELERHIDYWNGYLGEEVAPLALPLDFPRPLEQRFDGAAVPVELPPSLAAALLEFCRAERCTPFVVLLAAWQALLARYTGQGDFAVGVPSAGRQREEMQDLMGFFVTTQVYRARLPAGMTLRQLCRQVRGDAIAALNHGEVPLDTLLANRKDRREPGRSPLFQVLFSAQMADGAATLDLRGLAAEALPLPHTSAKYELSLDLNIGADGVRGQLEYATHLFSEATAQRLAGYYRRLLEALAADADQPLDRQELPGAGERTQLRQWGAAGAQFPEAMPVQRQIERRARENPDAVALVFGEETLTYGQLNRRANRLAHHLISLGVKPEVKVGLAVERSFEMLVGLLAILKAGGAYVPLDPDYPPERLAYTIGDSGIELLLTQSHLRERLPLQEGLQLLELDTLSLQSGPDSNPDIEVRGDNLAYVIYTSGSTGRPKGAQLCHRNIARLLSATDHWFHFGSGDVWTLFHSYAFDFSVWEIFGALCTGGRLVIVPHWVSRSPEDLLQLLRRQRVTVLNQTPSAFGQLMSVAGLYDAPLALRAVIFGGEALEPEMLRPWIEQWGDGDAGAGGPRLINMYGITETTVHVTFRPITRRDLGARRSPLGAAIPDLGLRVLDGAMNLVATGVPGELYVCGDGLARGYLQRPDLTAERFVADPQGTAGQRLYRTGDLVRWNGDGQLEYLGRIDQQVKIRGFRIELGEIETRLLACPGVCDAVVIAADDRLVAYVCAGAGEAVDPAQLRARLGEALPDYMVPGAIAQLERLPLNANGKVDRKALPAVAIASGASYEAPRGTTEETLARIWATLLGVERVGRADNFFELGGHSLLALKLLERMRAEGMTAQVRHLFQHPQLADFAAAVTRGNKHSEIAVPPNRIPDGCSAIAPEMLTLVELDADEIARIEAAVPGGAANIRDIYPLAPLQEGMLFHHLLDSEADAYVTAHTLAFDSREWLERFMACFNRVIERHDILRTAVLWEGLGGPVQVVCRQAPLQLEWLSNDAGDSAVAQLDARAHPRRHRIDVRRAPLFHGVAVFDAASERWLLRLLGHHLVRDHTTMECIIEEIALIQRGRDAQLPQPLPFRDFVARSRQRGGDAAQRAFFTRMLADVEEPTAPFGLVDIQGDGSDIEELQLPLERGLAQRIRQQAQRCGVSAASLFHLAWALVLGRTAGRDDLVFGTVLFGRLQGDAGAERALGMLINTLPIRIRLRNRDARQALRQTQEALTELMQHEHASLVQAQRCSGLPGGTPLFSSLLNYRYNQREEVRGAHFWDGMELLQSEDRTNYPVLINVDDLGDGFQLVAQVAASAGAGRLCGYLVAALGGLVQALESDSGHRISELELMDGPELQQQQRWGRPAVGEVATDTVQGLIGQQVRETPEAPALIVGDKVYSYRELDTRANRLARRLIRMGVGPEVRVGLSVERSADSVVGLLAILKAGGVYVPLDAEFPRDRLKYIAESSDIRVLLTHSHLQARFPTCAGLALLSLDGLDLSGESAADPGIAVHADNLAYVLYTSGSTGLPKGIEMSHRVLSQLTQWQMQRLPGAPRTLMFASPCFDVAFQELASCLAAGGALVQTREEERRDFGLLLELIARHSVERIFLPFAVLQLFAEAALASGACLPQLKEVITAGEQLKLTRPLRDWLQREGQIQLVNQYGPTESHVVSDFPLPRDYVQDPARELPPIGRPASGACLRVLDGSLRPVPQGVPGELYIGAAALARGYLDRPALTCERFVADPFDDRGGRLYRTGDLVRWNSDGQLEYLQRIDHQVKVRGFRIELSEIETQLLSQTEVREAVVVAQGDPGAARLVAYVSPVAGQCIDTVQLRQRLGRTLPDYMVPGVMLVLDNLPLNANGKVDRRALPEPELAPVASYEAPRGEAEETLAAIWTEVLDVQRVGRQDNFFELGGHSLLAVQLAARVQASLRMKLTIRDIFTHPSLADMAALVADSAQPEKIDESLSEIDAFIDNLEAV
ncbi:non-ribosomal peptide synthetase [Microbulbifer taiwanensis]|uniref:Non-ribosomal peptide synthetase n=1 Tax=Microbulbifer taiwanensis TaxID=986746 RepID=A0ABW1YMN2_9GAMM|nr:non-ribosomal peptide synthetase [Microbulbifer taiwanensis]